MMCVFFTVMLSRCNMAAVHISVQRARSPQFLSAKCLCFGFPSANHFAKDLIDKIVYGPHFLKGHCPDYAHGRASSVFLKNTTELSF